MPDFWPLALDRCFPQELVGCLPPTFRKIQDFTHLMLLLGVIAGCILIIRDITTLYHMNCKAEWMCAQEILDIVFLLPCTYQLVTMLGHYDDRMQSRLKEVEAKKAELTEAYTAMIEDMDGMLGRAADSSAGLAEKNFTAHRRDFIHFLEACLKRYHESYSGCKVDEVRFLDQFRKLLRHWLKAFEEASIDPEENPIQIEKFNNEFNLYGSMKTLVEEVCDRLRKTELKMVTVRQTQDQQLVNNLKTDLAEHQATATSENNGQAASSDPEPGALAVSTPPAQQALVAAAPERGGLRELRNIAGATSEDRDCTWCSFCQPGTPCGCKTTGEDFWPVSIGASVFHMHLLCREHAQMIAGICVGAALSLVNATSPAWGAVTAAEALLETAPIGIYTVCLTVLVMHIEQICQLLCLEREVAKLKEQREKVAHFNKEMADFWGDVQQLTDLWLYRTIPRLDLFKEFNHYLSDADPAAVVGHLRDVNNRLEQLENAIGTLQEWRGCQRAEASENWQRSLGEGVNRAIRSSGSNNLISLVTHLDDELAQGLVTLPSGQAALPTPSGPASGPPVFRGGENQSGGAVELMETSRAEVPANSAASDNV